MIKKIGFMVIVLALQACTGGGSVKSTAPNVTSEPSGANVFADNHKLGVSPLKVDLVKAFPASWGGNWEYQARGTLIFKKAGCEDFTMKVNDYIIVRPVHVKLKCNKKAVKKAKEVQAAPVVKKVEPVAMPMKKKMSKTEKRLKELSELYRKGVITKDEYMKTRKRILSEI